MASSIVPTSFLVFNDFKMQAQTQDLLQVLGQPNYLEVREWSDLSQYTQNILIQAEQEAIEEVSSYIRGRYLTQEIYAPTQLWNSGATYFGNNLVIYSQPYYSASTAYNIGDQFNYQGLIYSANTYMSGSTNPLTGATYICLQDQLFYANLPCPAFSPTTNYQPGNLVWFQDNIYQCKQNVYGITPSTSQNLELRFGIPSIQGNTNQFNFNSNFQPNPLPNINTTNWSLYNGVVSSWFTGTTYYFSGINPTQNTTYWTPGDNRNPQIVMYTIDIALYHLFSRINPRNIPELRSIRYDGASPAQLGGAIGWLKKVQTGKVNLNVPEIVPSQGGSIVFGSTPKYITAF